MSTKRKCKYLDCDDDMDTGDEVHWPGLDVLNIFSKSGQDQGRSFPGSAGITMLAEEYDTMDTGPGRYPRRPA